MTILDLEYCFNPITKIKPGKRKDVYDLQMEDGKEPAFLANGICSHNTHKYYADAFQQNRMIKAAFNIECQASVIDYTEVGLLDAAQLTLVNLVGNAADPVFSGNYLVAAKTRHIQGTFYRERFEFLRQGPGGGGGDGGGG